MCAVLFIDEAYYLYRPENERDYGQESIEILMQVMENQRDDLVVILAGYKERMDTYVAQLPVAEAERKRLSQMIPDIHGEKTKFYSSFVHDAAVPLRSAVAAGLWTVVTPTFWTEGSDFSAAGPLLPSLGDPASPLPGEPGRQLHAAAWLTLPELLQIKRGRGH